METRRKPGGPLYEEITVKLKEKIVSGELSPGDLLPSENELRAQFSTSRETVRKSLKLLEADDYIYSRAGKGYYVKKPDYNRYVMKLHENRDDTVLKHISVTLPSSEVQRALDLDDRQRVIEIVRVTSRNGGPVACELRYFPYGQGQPTIESDIQYSVFPEVAAGKTSAFAFVTEMEINAEPAGETAVRYLNCEENSPLLVVRRHLIGSNRQKLGFAIRYMLPSYGGLSASAGTGNT